MTFKSKLCQIFFTLNIFFSWTLTYFFEPGIQNYGSHLKGILIFFFYQLLEKENLFPQYYVLGLKMTFTVLEEINWNPRAGNSYPFIHHSADNFTSCMLFVCALMSFEFFIWSSWSFSKILNTNFLDNITMLVEGNEISMNWMKCYHELIKVLLILLCTGFDRA